MTKSISVNTETKLPKLVPKVKYGNYSKDLCRFEIEKTNFLCLLIKKWKFT